MQVINALLSHPILLAYFSGADNYTWVHFRNGKRQLLAKPLAYFEKQLPGFVRVHKIALVNPVVVADIQPPPRPKMPGAVYLHDGTRLPISRRRWMAVLTALQVANPPGAAVPLPASMQQEAHVLPPVTILARLAGDAHLLTEQCLLELGIAFDLKITKTASELVHELYQTPNQEWPVLILLDARTERTYNLACLETLKRDPHLRVIPVIWLTNQTDNADQVYQLDANSVVAVTNEPNSFVRVLSQVMHYWLFVVQLPGREQPKRLSNQMTVATAQE